MATPGRVLRLSAAAFAAVMLAAAGASVAHAEEQHGQDEIDVTVDIVEIDEPGTLALSVGAGSATLTESGSTDLERQFVGSLPTVTVTDTRYPDGVPSGAAWYVLGTASDFEGNEDQTAISAGNLGWTPNLVGYDGDGDVFAGEPVDSVIDGGPGLVDAELLVATADSAAVGGEGSWTASADLVLRTGADIAAGSYSSTITLSLFE